VRSVERVVPFVQSVFPAVLVKELLKINRTSGLCVLDSDRIWGRVFVPVTFTGISAPAPCL